MAKHIKVLIVDDSPLTRLLYTELLNSDTDIEVIGEASNAMEAEERIKALKPTVVTLDVKMPKVDGLAFLEKLMKENPMPVVMVSALTQKGAMATIKALELGAIDYVSKPLQRQKEEGLMALKDDLIRKVRIASQAKVRGTVTTNPDTVKAPPIGLDTHKIVAIGASTGGVEALGKILSRIPTNFPPILIVQHMPKRFTESFAKRLNTLCEIKVHEAKDGQRIFSGNAYIAPGGLQLRIANDDNGDYYCKVEEGERVSGHCPSVDVLFDSVAEEVEEHAIGVILTGMGKDGSNGMLKMKQNGAQTIGQSEDSCVVYGMPKAAVNNNAVDTEVHLDDVAQEIVNCLIARRNKKDDSQEERV